MCPALCAGPPGTPSPGRAPHTCRLRAQLFPLPSPHSGPCTLPRTGRSAPRPAARPRHPPKETAKGPSARSGHLGRSFPGPHRPTPFHLPSGSPWPPHIHTDLGRRPSPGWRGSAHPQDRPHLGCRLVSEKLHRRAGPPASSVLRGQSGDGEVLRSTEPLGGVLMAVRPRAQLRPSGRGARGPSVEPSSPLPGWASLPTPVSPASCLGWGRWPSQAHGREVLCGLWGLPERLRKGSCLRRDRATSSQPRDPVRVPATGRAAVLPPVSSQGRPPLPCTWAKEGLGLPWLLHPVHVLTDLPGGRAIGTPGPIPPSTLQRRAGPTGPGADGEAGSSQASISYLVS